jgi:hypothetical protein
VLPSEYIIPLFKRIQSKFIEFYLSQKDLEKVKKHFESINKTREKWSDKKDKKKRRKKGFFYSNFDLMYLFPDGVFSKTENFTVDQNMTKLSNSRSSTGSSCSVINPFLKNVSSIENLYNELSEKNIWDLISVKNLFNTNQQIFEDAIANIRQIKDYTLFESNLEPEKNPMYFLLLKLYNLNDFFPVNTGKDGNCFYNSISFLLFGTERYFFLIKMCSIFILLKNHELFETYIRRTSYDKTYEEVILDSCIRNEYANIINIFSTSILLNRTIYCYCVNEQNIPYGYKYKPNEAQNKPIFLAFYVNHFWSLVSIKNAEEYTEIENDCFVQLRSLVKF